MSRFDEETGEYCWAEEGGADVPPWAIALWALAAVIVGPGMAWLLMGGMTQ